METRVTKLLGIEYPIIQGGMAWVANANLAANVSKAGGIGFIGAGRIGLTHFCFASAKVDIIFKTTILSNTFF